MEDETINAFADLLLLIAEREIKVAYKNIINLL